MGEKMLPMKIRTESLFYFLEYLYSIAVNYDCMDTTVL